MAIKMHRTTIDVDVEAYERAREALGTNGYKDTVNAALREAGRRQALANAAAYIREGRFPAATLEELAELRKPRSG
jgi:Arc/MetJ family transcription regulator